MTSEHDVDRVPPDGWGPLVIRDPHGAAELAARIAEDARHPLGDRARAAAGLGGALFDLARHAEAVTAMHRAMELATESGDRAALCSVTMSASVVLAEAGAVDEGLAQLAALSAMPDLAEVAGATLPGKVEFQKAYILQNSGRLPEALASVELAGTLWGGVDDPDVWVRYHLTRGNLLVSQFRFEPAEADLLEAARIAADAGIPSLVGMAYSNLGVLYGCAGRLLDGLRAFDRARAAFDAAGDRGRRFVLSQGGRAELLMYSGMVAEAVSVARATLAAVEPTGNAVLLGDLQLDVARTELAAGNRGAAVRAAEAAEVTFLAAQRPEMVSHAWAVAARAGLAAARNGDFPDAVRAARVALAALRDSGWDERADEVVLEIVRSAHRIGSIGSVADEITGLHRAAGATGAQPMQVLGGRYAGALDAAAGGDHAAAVAACSHGLDVLDGIVAEAPSLELRASAVRLGRDLSDLLVELTLDRGDARAVFGAAEGTRARALHDELSVSGPYAGLSGPAAAQLLADVNGRLAGRTLVEWIESRGRVWALLVTDDVTMVDVAAAEDVQRLVDRLVRWFDQAPFDPDLPPERAAAAAGDLDALLLGPLGLTEATPLVVVPDGALHHVPWAALPTLARRSFSVVPGASLWLAAEAAARRTAGVPGVGVVVGPDVDRTGAERHAVRGAHSEVELRDGADATAAAAGALLASRDMVHVAAHGEFRADRPLLSTLELADGAAPAAELVPPRVAARVVVMSSCEGGAHGTARGADVLGLAALLVARGAASVIAPLTPVDDLECARFMSAVHCCLAGGASAGAALAEVRADWLRAGRLADWAVAGLFACFGSESTSHVSGGPIAAL